MFLTFVVLALSLGFFSARRWRELALETAARERTEEELRRAMELLEGKLRDGDARAAETARMLNDETAKRIEAQSALKMTEESFRDFLESASDLVQIVAPDGKIVYVNRAWKESLGYGDDDVRNLSIFDVVAPDHRERCEVVFKRILRGENVDRIETVFVSISGRRIIVEGSVNGRFDNGRLASCRGIFRDVTDRRAAERRLSLQHATARILAGASSVEEAAPRLLAAAGDKMGWDAGVFWLADRDGAAVKAVASWSGRGAAGDGIRGNPQVDPLGAEIDAPRRVISCGAPCWIEDVLREPSYRRPGAGDDAGFRSALAFPVMLAGRAAAVVELFSREPRAPDVPTLGAAASLGAQIAQFLTRVRAEEDLRAAKRVAEEANGAKSRFLAHMSHELRTPLNSVIGFANILLKNPREQDATYVRRIRDNGIHLLQIINGILDLSKIESGREELDLSPVALGELVMDTIRQAECQINGRPIELSAEIPAHLAPMTSDAMKLKRVIINLLSNAIKFTAAGRVTVRVTADPATSFPVRLDVTDTGIGIPEDRREAIFEAFRQAGPDMSRRYGGTGLGLAISRRLCEMMGYRLTLRSEVGKGSTFSVHFREEGAVPLAGEESYERERSACSN